MDIRKIKKLIELIDRSGVGEIEIHEGEESIRIARAGQVVKAGKAKHASSLEELPTTETVPDDSVASDAASDALPDGITIKSPMIGVFYAAPSPDVEPFVTLDQSVNAGDTLCIIEAMKMMNQIDAELSGTIVKIFPEDGQPVEYGQPLFIIKQD